MVVTQFLYGFSNVIVKCHCDLSKVVAWLSMRVVSCEYGCSIVCARFCVI